MITAVGSFRDVCDFRTVGSVEDGGWGVCSDKTTLIGSALKSLLVQRLKVYFMSLGKKTLVMNVEAA